MAKRSQPSWTLPENENKHSLQLLNSLTRKKELFQSKFGNNIRSYSCGPTTYDKPHLGHARTYISFDIIRRVLVDYFGYTMTSQMNITDVDDKIIIRARQNYLFEKYLLEKRTPEELKNDLKEVSNRLDKTIKSTIDEEKKEMYEQSLKKLNESIEELTNNIHPNDKEPITVQMKQKFIENNEDPISSWLDTKYGASITDKTIFMGLAQYWETDFHQDMEALNILKPTILTRVSEYIPEIIEFIQCIMKNGYGYEANGSVYFDVAEFDNTENHHYAKLVPEAYGNTNRLIEGEGDLTSTEQYKEKHSPNDFCLWKRSKPGEPSWESPWGFGRPGWHIECSAMASTIFGQHLDIHTGGVDLKFPHHDNELAQSEAYFESSNWVQYFLHAGHLTISGCKMSKSLKNFISIRDALSKYTARQIRFLFLLHSWPDTLDYSENTMETAIQYEKLFNEFFLNVKDETRNLYKEKVTAKSFRKWTEKEINLNKALLEAKEGVHKALCDNIDTKTAMEALRQLVADGNMYLRDVQTKNKYLLHDVVVYITKILKIFGAIWEPPKIGFPIVGDESENFEDVVMPYLQILAEFRDTIRDAAKSLNATTIITECDKLRDEILPKVGVRLEDRITLPSVIKFVERKIKEK